jgi:predicted DNA-binding transcriptional regulator AlpA
MMECFATLLTETQAAQFLTMSIKTLQAWRARGQGPHFVKIGRSVRYQKGKVDALHWGAATAVHFRPWGRDPLKHDHNIRPGYSAMNVVQSSRIALQEGYDELLSRWHWDLYTTNTFQNDIHPEKVHRRWRLWIAKMNRHLYGHRWQEHGKGLYWCRVSEYQQRGVLHFHGLLSGPRAATLDLRRCQDQWFRLGGQARIERPKSQQAVQRYITKYVLRGVEIDFGGPLMSENGWRNGGHGGKL